MSLQDCKGLRRRYGYCLCDKAKSKYISDYPKRQTVNNSYTRYHAYSPHWNTIVVVFYKTMGD